MRFSALFFVSAFLLSVASHAHATHYKLFVVTGESNSLGSTAAGESDPSSGSDPADQHILFFWNNKANSSTSIGSSSNLFSTSQDQQGGHYTGSASHWGPEITFGRTLYRAGVRDFAIIKATHGDAEGNTAWLKNSSDDHMYDHVVNTVTAATTELTNNGHTYEIVGFIYQQGESDSSSEATAAGTRLKNLVDNLRSDLPLASSMHACVAGVAAAGSNRDSVRTNQAATAGSTSYIDYVDTLDLQSYLHDNLNFNKQGKTTVGERLAVRFLDAGLPNIKRFYGRLTCIGDSITQGGNGDHPSYRYPLFTHLANKSVPIDAATGYKFTGSVTGAYNHYSVTTPNVNGQTFENVHEGHFGWRAFWENGRLPIPTNRHSGNRGEGTIECWTGQETQYESGSVGNWVNYPVPFAGSGNTGTTYTPDTVVILIGINDLGDAPHDAVQANADISLMIDQLRAANANVRIHLNLVLPADRNLSWEETKVDELNGYLITLAATKNAASSTSPVWIVDAATGFNPTTMAYDNLHPNDIGEAYVGDHVAASLGLIQTPLPPAPPEPPHTEANSSTFTHTFEGNEIFNGTNFINNWAEWDGADTSDSLVGDGSNLRHTHTNGDDSWLALTDTGWADVRSGDWTWEARLKFHANPNGYFLWIGTGSNRIYLEIHGDRTQDFGNENFNKAHDNLDGNFHTFRIIHESNVGKYHVFRDGVRLTTLAGEDYDSSSSESRFFMGDYTSGSFGNNYDVEIDYVRYGSGLFIPTGTDSDGDGLNDAWEYDNFGDLTSASPSADTDNDGQSNLDEYLADTNPNSHTSRFQIVAHAEDGSSSTDIQISSSTQRSYTLYRSFDLSAESWVAIDGPVNGNGATLTLQDTSDPSTQGNRFYRVEVSAP